MNSIRPLVTITILGLVGAFLYVKINQGPIRPADEAKESWSADRSTGTTEGGTAPQWASPSLASTSEATTTTTPSLPQTLAVHEAVHESGTMSSTPLGLPSIPTVPELPPLPPLSKTEAQTTEAQVAEAQTRTVATSSLIGSPTIQGTTSIAPPVNIPMAHYGSESSSASLSAGGSTSISGSVPSLGTVVGGQGPAAGAGPPVGETTPFATAWPVIQAALQQGELARAHLLLSGWYGDPNLAPAEQEQVKSLLGQLAGTVVYSNQHRLEPAYTVQAGDTLKSIAQKQNIPWQLLAKINGIAASNQVQPGQQIKILRGPFAAVIERTKGQLTLMLDGRYAGQFPITVPPGALSGEGEWLVEKKLVHPASGVYQASTASAAGLAAVDRVLVLRSESPEGGGPTLTIASGTSSLSNPTEVSGTTIRISAQDAEELTDILSIGSRVMIRR